MDAPYQDPFPGPNPYPKIDVKDAPDTMVAQRDVVLHCLQDFLRESRNSAYEWQVKSKKAWDMIHGRIDWYHKNRDQ